ncbi:MAG: ClpXP protease specificity-enhancing factor [Sulfuritalea sp.]|jgi:stringent starvation protein B|nr:ClpXP protease specificity-enhancing factor [Sulfuritalea sp.]
MKSTKPYLIRAIHEWCADQGFTPYLAVKVDATTRVPREFVKEGEIVLNVGLEATHQLSMGNEEITFQARFGGRAFPVVVPIERVSAIYASENGEGMAFEVTEKPAAADGETPDAGKEETSPAASPGPTPERSPGRPVLTRVK